MRVKLFLLLLVLICSEAKCLPVVQSSPLRDPMALRLGACINCHGDQGKEGPDGYYPRLSAKPAMYLYNQLKNFKEERRKYHLMSGLLAPLSDSYLWDIAQYFSDLDVPYAPPTLLSKDSADYRRGEVLATKGDKSKSLPACTQCHGLELTGVLPAAPALVGLPRDYLNAQIGGWQTGHRVANAPDCMADIAKKLSPQDVSAVALWLSQQISSKLAKPAPRHTQLQGNAAEVACGSEQQSIPSSASQDLAGSDLSSAERRGAYLARIGNCALCHTAPGSPAYAGGRSIETPFGTVFSSNITPEIKTGIGSWSRDDFWNALHHGRSKSGRLLSPAFPYTSYTHVTRDDANALFAFLKRNPPVTRQNTEHSLQWPFGTQAAIFAWRALYFDEGSSQKSGDTPIERGAYLVRGLAHCNECHGRRNQLGALESSNTFSGGTLPGLGWYAPALEGQRGGRDWSIENLRKWLQTGAIEPGKAAFAGGPMAEVIHHSTQFLSDEDARAIASYLASAPGPLKAQVATATLGIAKVAIGSDSHAAMIYESKCAQCHGKQGQGIEGAVPALAGNPMVVSSKSNNLVLSVLYGGFAPSTSANPKPYGMPPYMLDLNDADLAQLLTWIRDSWGNQAPVITPLDVLKVRNANLR